MEMGIALELRGLQNLIEERVSREIDCTSWACRFQKTWTELDLEQALVVSRFQVCCHDRRTVECLMAAGAAINRRGDGTFYLVASTRLSLLPSTVTTKLHTLILAIFSLLQRESAQYPATCEGRALSGHRSRLCEIAFVLPREVWSQCPASWNPNMN